MSPVFWLGTHQPGWLACLDVPLVASHRTLRDRRRLPRAIAPWALDSGGFTELAMFGRWQTTPAQYAEAVAPLRRRGRPPGLGGAAGLNVLRGHQRRPDHPAAPRFSNTS